MIEYLKNKIIVDLIVTLAVLINLSFFIYKVARDMKNKPKRKRIYIYSCLKCFTVFPVNKNKKCVYCDSSDLEKGYYYED